MDLKKATERSVDSLQRIYAFAIALALGEGIRRLVVNPSTAEIEFHPDYLPPFLALLVTLVPFYHGMNRHLDEAYLSTAPKTPPGGALLFDFLFFFAEAAYLFALAVMISKPQSFCRAMAVLFLADAGWAVVTYWISDGMGKRWAVLNGAAGVLTLFFCFQIVLPTHINPWAVTVVAAVRSLADYWWCWSYYFPSRSTE